MGAARQASAIWAGLLLLLLGTGREAGAVYFSFPNPTYPPLFRPDSVLACTGWKVANVSADQFCSVSQNGLSFELTPYSGTGADAFNSSARLMYNRSIRFYDPVSAEKASFSTFFVFAIRHVADAPLLGSGMTFLIAPNTSTPVKSIGGDLGLFDSNTTTGRPIDGGPSRVVAVEFDTYSYRDFDKVPAPHVGLDIDSLDSASVAYLWNDSVLTQQKIAVWIDYDAPGQSLEVRLLNVTDGEQIRRQDAVLWLTFSGLNLSEHIEEYSYVGFSSASGSNVDGRGELNIVYDWQFSTSGVADGDGGGGSRARVVIGVVLAVSTATLLGAVLAFFVWRRRRRGQGLELNKGAGWPFLSKAATGLEGLGFSGLDGPREFSYQELRVATSGFSDRSVLGEGGFGRVYKGVFPDNSVVAVKKVAQHSRQGEREFLSELTTIGRLRHRNLVPLKGWCKNENELLLVYEYMPNGSLFDHLFQHATDSDGEEPNEPMIETRLGIPPPKDVLGWDQRFKIIHGVASALHYLHSEWEEQSLIHRDVKSSNVLLDANWNARLGDFGLARVVKRNKAAATVTNTAGTRGYLAPETLYSDKVSAESDVFSFGVLALEVVTGRKPIEWLRSPEEKFLVNWVWALNQKKTLLDAADPLLASEYDAGQLLTVLKVGLLCCAEAPKQRPNMRQVLHYFSTGNVPNPPESSAPVDFTLGSIPSSSLGTSASTTVTLEDFSSSR